MEGSIPSVSSSLSISFLSSLTRHYHLPFALRESSPRRNVWVNALLAFGLYLDSRVHFCDKSVNSGMGCGREVGLSLMTSSGSSEGRASVDRELPDHHT